MALGARPRAPAGAGRQALQALSRTSLWTDPKITIVAERDGLIVIDKPPGLPTSGHTLDDPFCAQHQLMTLFRRKRIWAVHQLDKGTSGLNLFVLRKALVKVWMQRLRGGGGAKRYLAVVHGELHSERVVDAPLGRIRRADGREVPAVTEGGKPSLTRLIPRALAPGFSLVEARPATGRTHQVRLHLAHIGHPLVGEPFHRDPPCTLHPRHALHAHILDFGPEIGRFEAPLPDDLRALLARLGLGGYDERDERSRADRHQDPTK